MPFLSPFFIALKKNDEAFLNTLGLQSIGFIMIEMLRMFFTQPASELRPGIPFDLKIKRWAVIEHELEDPWFQLDLTLSESGVEISRTMMIAEIGDLLHMLETHPKSARVRAVMVMISPKTNGSDLWQLEQVPTIDAGLLGTSGAGQVRLTTNNRLIVLPTVLPIDTKRLYSAT
jgi:hypothetical protein